MELYAKTKLVPDTAITLDDKSFLKRGVRRPAAWYYWSAAASVALVIGMYFLFNRNNTPNGNTIVKHNQVKDSNAIVNHVVKSIDTTPAIQKVTPTIPIIHTVKNNTVAIKAQQNRQRRDEKGIPNNAVKDSSAIAVNKGGKENNQVAPIKRQTTIPNHSGNDTIAIKNTNSPDTLHIGIPLIKEDIHYKMIKEKSLPELVIKSSNNTPRDTSSIGVSVIKENSNQPKVAIIETPKKREKGKLLLRLAALVCKGLHKVTGQHIELEKHYDSDDSTIVAYQLDLGNKAIQFPVKD